MFQRPRTRHIATFVILLAATALVAHAKGRSAPADAAPATPDIAPVAANPPRIEVAFVLDTTGSMSGLIEGAKRKIWSIANRMADGTPTPHIRFGLIGYRDRGDAYVTRSFDLTEDIDAIYEKLQAFRAEGGGDTPESVNQALHEAVTRMSWSPGQDVYKVIFLVGDAPPHTDYQDDVAYPETVRLATARHIRINTVQCGTLPSTTPIWQQIASEGLGEFVTIRQDGAMVAVSAPQDDALMRLNRDLGATVLPWGSPMERADIERKRDMAAVASAPVAASRLAYLGKTGGRVNAGAGDLVDAVKEGVVDPANLPAEMLPEPMREMDDEARKAYVEARVAKRGELELQIKKLSKAREDYLRRDAARRAAAGEADSFDAKILDLIRQQAAEKGIRYE
jgi:hypothetical protein